MNYGILGAIVFVLGVYAIFRILTSGASTGSKVLWCILVLVLPVIGFIAWLVAGPK